MIKVLFIGDPCGKPGRKAIKKFLPKLKEKHNIDITIVNAENIAHGRGATIKTTREIMSYGVDFMTSGNHIWRRRKEIPELFSGEIPLIRGLNYPDDIPGKGYGEIDLGSKGKLLIINLIGWAFMNERTITEPFRRITEFLEEIDKDEYKGIILDFHAESTSEKIALGLYLDGKISAVLGTHTHVQTSDEKTLPKGTAYITDVGMTGPAESILWVKPEIIFQQNMYPYSPRYDIEEQGNIKLEAVLLEIEDASKPTSIQRIRIKD